jgi:hypothetical protein
LFIWFMAPNPCPLSIGSWLYCNTFFTFCSRFVQFFLKKLSFFSGGWGCFPVLRARWVYSQARIHAKKDCSSFLGEQLLPVKQMSDSTRLDILKNFQPEMVRIHAGRRRLDH